MKHFNFSVGDGDIEAISCALSAMPAYECFNDLSSEYAGLVSSTILKLNGHKHLNQREIYLIALAVDCAYKTFRGEITVDQEAVTELRPYFFTINKLYPQFSVFLDSDS